MTKLTDDELAELVAEKALKLKKVEIGYRDFTGSHRWKKVYELPGGGTILRARWDPCNDEFDKMTVIFEMKKKGTTIKNNKSGRAVCLSALKAAGVDVE